MMESSINICREAANASSQFEKSNSDLKKNYLIHNIMLYNYIATMIKGNCGSFGTGYPFYALRRDLIGQLPIIDEQFRYNDELISAVESSKHTTWSCDECLSKCYKCMPDLKQICKPCPNMDDNLKPRKVLNRLPDIDMWLVCDNDEIEAAKEKLITLFREFGMCSSDVDPIKTITDVIEISQAIKSGNMPKELLPIDAHIIDYSTIASLIEQVPYKIKQASKDGTIPYLPIHPLSYRKTWQKDDTAYNFIHDYLSSLTEFNFEGDLKQLLLETRKVIAETYSFEQLYNFLLSTGPESVKRRHKTLELKDRFRERINSWE